MNPEQATILIIDCGTMVGHQQTELELPLNIVSFFGLVAAGDEPAYLDMRLSNGILASFRAIYRADNGMWRIELSDAIPEIRAGVFPIVEGVRQRRSNHAAIFTKIVAGGSSDYDLQLVHIESAAYNDHLTKAAAGGNQYRTVKGEHGRNVGWY